MDAYQPAAMEPESNIAVNGTIDEWGNYIMKRGDEICIERDGVIENIQQNNPAITAVLVTADQETIGLVDWAAVGKSIGGSRHITSLDFHLDETILNPPDAQAFWGGLALNRSIENCWSFQTDIVTVQCRGSPFSMPSEIQSTWNQ